MAGALLVARWQASREARRQRAQMGAAAIAGALATITDASPEALALGSGPQMLAHLEEVREPWVTATRPALLEYSVRTESREARRLARKLAAEVPGLLNISAAYVDLAAKNFQTSGALGGTHLEAFNIAVGKHRAVQAASEELEQALRMDAGE